MDIEVSKGDMLMATTTFSDLPVTKSMKAELLIATTTSSLVNNTIIYTDMNGDGVTDIVNRSDEYIGENISSKRTYIKYYLESLKRIIYTLNLNPLFERLWIAKIDYLLKKISTN
jgi:hypothetical protein